MTRQMEMLFNQNYPSPKNQPSQDQHPCFDWELPPRSGSPKYLFHELIK